MMHKILISHPLYKPGMDELKRFAEIIITKDGDSDHIIDLLKDVEGFILRIGKIDRKAIEECPKLRVITRPGVGVDNVDVAAATENGIPVVICPAGNSRAVAEHTIALIFSVAKNIVESDKETRKGNFDIRNKYVAIELLDKIIAVVGFGHIGKIVASLCHGLGMKVIVYDPFFKKSDIEAYGYSYALEVEEALSLADFVTLHLPSFPETKNLFNDDRFSVMKRTSFLINCARGDIVDEKALFRALSEKKIAGAAVDVLVTEPMKADNPLMALSNFIVTPHMAAQTQETTSQIVKLAVEGTIAVLNGNKWPNVCNHEVYTHPRWREC